MLLQRVRLVLREDEDAAQAGMQTIAQSEVDDAIPSAERHGRLCPFGRQRMEARADSACKDDADRLVEHVFY